MNLTVISWIPPRRRADAIAWVALTAGWGLLVLLIGFHGEFPLNDDWAYSLTTKTLLETGHFERVAWTWAPIITNVGIGTVFSWIFGFSFETLRLSGLFMGWAGLLGTYCLCRQIGASPMSSLFGAAVVGLNPIYVNLSFTFMTDVPFTALTAWSLVFLVRWLAGSSWVALLVGTLLALATVLSRQPGLALPIALVGVIVLTRLKKLRHLLIIAGALAAVVGGYAFLPGLLFGPGDSGTLYGLEHLWKLVTSPYLFSHLVVNGMMLLSYLGVFLAPITLGLLRSDDRLVRVIALGSALLACPMLFLIWVKELRMPLGINVIYDLGLGPATVHGAEALPHAPAWIWWGMTAIGLGAGLCALGLTMKGLWSERGSWRRRPEWLLLVLFLMIFILPLGRTPYFDRYLLPLLPPAAALLFAASGYSLRLRGARGIVGVGLLVVLALFGVAGTRDYLEHHRARWVLLDALLGQGVSSREVAGGFEFTGWFNFDAALRRDARPDRIGWVHDDLYVLSLADQMPRYQSVATRSYRRLMPPGTQVLTLYQRVNSDHGSGVSPSPQDGAGPHR